MENKVILIGGLIGGLIALILVTVLTTSRYIVDPNKDIDAYMAARVNEAIAADAHITALVNGVNADNARMNAQLAQLRPDGTLRAPVVTPPPRPILPTLTCDNGYILQNGVCTKPVSFGSINTINRRDPIYNCPLNYKINLNNMQCVQSNNSRVQNVTKANPMCNTGYTFAQETTQGDVCRKPFKFGGQTAYTSQQPTYICPTNYLLKGANCYENI